MLGCREETMGKASSISEMGLKIRQLFRLMSSLSSMAHLAFGRAARTAGTSHGLGTHMLGNTEPTATSQPTHLRRSRRAPNNFPL